MLESKEESTESRSVKARLYLTHTHIHTYIFNGPEVGQVTRLQGSVAYWVEVKGETVCFCTFCRRVYSACTSQCIVEVLQCIVYSFNEFYT